MAHGVGKRRTERGEGAGRRRKTEGGRGPGNPGAGWREAEEREGDEAERAAGAPRPLTPVAAAIRQGHCPHFVDDKTEDQNTQ